MRVFNNRRVVMGRFIEAPTMSEILYEEFMEPLGISAYKLAQAIHVPVSRIQDILHDRRKVTVDTSLRLARFFGVSDRYFLDIQNDIDIRNLRISMADDIKMIHPYNTAVM
jgi:addiction module HigA family antidote